MEEAIDFDKKRKMNILAPAGNYEKLVAAVKAGANEVFFGLKGFGARRNNENLAMQEVFDGIDYAHSRGVKTLMTLNTILKDSEINSMYNNVKRVYEHGIDAVIVQDLGFVKFLKENFPDLKIHGSTQMTVANHVEANKLKELGLTRVCLARELSFEEIKSIREKTDIELEIFVSGSLCISYSGNCYISSFIGGRSGNRGLCAYSCRKKFTDENGENAYFLSPNDQLLQEKEINMLKDIGIDAIKVEGRKKSSEYVYETVSYYDNILKGTPRPTESYKLFNRGYSKGYFYLDNKLMNFKYSSNFGYFLGARIGESNNFKIDDELILGDGVQFVDENFEQIGGEYVNKIRIIETGKNGNSEKKNKKQNGKSENIEKISKADRFDIISIGKLPKGTRYIYKNYSKEINDRIIHNIKISKRYAAVNATLLAKKGHKIELTLEIENLKNEIISVTKKGNIIEQDAKKLITKEQIAEKIGELGDTTFELGKIQIDYDGTSFIPFSELKTLKRECVSELLEKLLESYKRTAIERKKYDFETNKNSENMESGKDKNSKKPIVSALVTNDEQENVCREMGITKVYRKQFDVAKEKNLSKTNKIKIGTNLASNLYQAIMGEKTGVKGQTLDWNLNVFNNHAIEMFSSFKNLETVFLSPELSYRQLKNIKSDKLKKGLVIYGHLKGMYIEHKIFDKEYKELEGEFYDKYKIVRNELDNIELYLDKPMNLIPRLDDIYELNLDELRLDFTFEKADEVKQIIKSIDTKSGKYTPYAFEQGVL
ncbi:peptidase U32 [Leptotrichia trevisanii]|uniref:Peptidase U32 n=1 Tax=Leptotrichia trevisanii TaxID=109328 RepID=A0A510K231_9FUSO|nr:U32 family peptidase [Leptotrichia trevisanii]BBM45544.1 peptidase U32 [Leptotrichia trevisanii]BBM57564.1 peptidase U32 [Leptotrichia trevisanii]